LCYWEPRQSFIRITTYNEDGEGAAINIATEKEYGDLMDLVKRNFENLNED